ncbi:hypothetical protein GCM10009555_068730 [Acrocarpospora macrocephala]|uniref:Uncharacterized protein n=1 Tax=Acrocarpospora macrocephala TaxID=150177 RepID=A0A5M3X949_9ACTN|nr:hypothetical protein [Acrocarpospora macrocephala]GES16051.1 hypothetical protein Amac_096490 [Acrocarpospora macrocephala]
MSIQTLAASTIYKDLVDERIRGLHQEAAEHSIASRVRSVQKARRQAERASARLRAALARA